MNVHIQSKNKINNTGNIGFYLIICYLLIDLARIQTLIPIGAIRPGLIITILLSIFVLSKNNFCFSFPEIKIIWFFLFLLICYVPFARNNSYAYRTATSFAVFVPFIITIVITTDSLNKLIKLINVILCTAIYQSIASFTHAGKGSGGWFNDENDLSLFINVNLPMFYFLLIGKKNNNKQKLFYITGLVLGLLAVVNSFSRGGFIGLLAITIFIFWMSSKQKLISSLIIIMFGLLLYYFGSDAYWQEMGTVTDTQDGTAQARINSWISAWRMFLDKPWGVGGNNFQVWFPEYQTEWFKRGMWGRVAHSLWFTLLPELGILGTLLYFNLMWKNYKSLRDIIKDQNKYADQEIFVCIAKGLLVGLVGFFASGTFLSVLYYPYFWYITAIIVAMKNIEINKIA